MIKRVFRYMLMIGLIAFGLAWNGDIRTCSTGQVVTSAAALIGAPATPISYAGVARRTTVRVATPGLGAPGVGVQPGNRGGPVNRVGRF